MKCKRYFRWTFPATRSGDEEVDPAAVSMLGDMGFPYDQVPAEYWRALGFD